MKKTVWLIANAASGSNSEKSLAEVRAALSGAGHVPQRVIDLGQGIPRAADLDEAGVETLVVFGGDGSVNAVATALEGWGGALLVLPGGTANLLARSLHGEAEAAQIAARLPRLRRRRRTCIRGIRGTALAEVLAGPGASWTDVREELREGGVAGLAETAAAAIRESTSGPMVALVNPPLGRSEGYAGIRLVPGPSAMEIEGFGANNAADYLKQGLALIRRNFREGPHDELGFHEAVTCRSLGSAPIALMIDGERREGAAQESFFLAPFALDLLG